MPNPMTPGASLRSEQHNSYVLAVVVRLFLPLQDQLRFGPEERKLMALETIAEAARLWIVSELKFDPYSLPYPRVKGKVLKPLSHKSPQLSPRVKGKVLKPGGSTIAGRVGTITWADNVAETFAQDDASTMDRVAAVTSLIPFVGCGTQLGAYAGDGEITVLEGIDTALCGLGDALLLGVATAPFGAVVRLSRTIISAIAAWGHSSSPLPQKPSPLPQNPSPLPQEPTSYLPHMPSRSDIQSLRDGLWRYFINREVLNFISSEAFKNKLESALTIVSLRNLSRGAQAIGLILAGQEVSEEFLMTDPMYDEADQFTDPWNATRQEAVPPDNQELAQTPAETAKAISKIISILSTRNLDEQRWTLLQLVKEGMPDVIIRLRDDFNDKFIESLTSNDMIAQYTQAHAHFGDIGRRESNWVIGNITQYFTSEGKYLKEAPLPLPSDLALAYWIGFTTNSSHKPIIDPRITDPERYYADTVGKVDKDILQDHTQDVMQLLRGELTHAQLPSDGPKELWDKHLQLLIAMHIGGRTTPGKKHYLWSSGIINAFPDPATGPDPGTREALRIERALRQGGT
ncbi:hypothetical protein HRG_008929 [Hirsutella rhossiliensis]|uniref:Uncharacterized protein n=1 Tax=Hirsutella rhossiliensis TaxID=111463 RepID=A0A9P8MPG8_9HYPO|nr:uncharacterized protein HRG_08929 [Hirsutella rhossiliensis]KAH0959908.1 hypothetical protein HRG_08929 [Hirsutella rhossiliensis]